MKEEVGMSLALEGSFSLVMVLDWRVNTSYLGSKQNGGCGGNADGELSR